MTGVHTGRVTMNMEHGGGSAGISHGGGSAGIRETMIGDGGTTFIDGGSAFIGNEGGRD
jgi:hypothetical protein